MKRPIVRFALVLASFSLACAPPTRPGGSGGNGGGGNGGGGSGGGGSGGGGSGGGGSGGSGGAAGPCVDGESVCDGADVKMCAGGKPSGPAIESCGGGDACSGGRCTSPACADAESKRNFIGCQFYAFHVDNSEHDDPKAVLLLLGNPSDADMAMVKVQKRSGATWADVATVTLAPGGVQTYTLPKPKFQDGGGIATEAAFRVRSNAPVVAYQVQSDDRDVDSETAGGTMLIPSHVFGRSYMPITYTQKTTTETKSYGTLASASQVAVVGAQDGTKVTFIAGPSGATHAGGGVPAVAPGDSFEFMLSEGDVYTVYSAKDGDDLTGSLISADHPIAVFSGNIGTTYGKTGTGLQSADMTHEQMIPLSAWGKQYVASRLLPQSQCGKAGELGVSLWRVLASEDGTSVSFEAPMGVTGVPVDPMTLDRGRYIELGVGGIKGAEGDFFIKADKPVLVAQFTACEPHMALAVSAEQLLTDFLFVVPPIFDHQLAIVRKGGSMVTMDGMPLMDSQFVPAGGGFEVARVNVPGCKGAIKSCGHRLRGTEIGVAVRGQDTICGYAFSGGMGVRCVNKTAGCR